jgi:hypothetical protein
MPSYVAFFYAPATNLTPPLFDVDFRCRTANTGRAAAIGPSAVRGGRFKFDGHVGAVPRLWPFCVAFPRMDENRSKLSRTETAAVFVFILICALAAMCQKAWYVDNRPPDAPLQKNFP